MMSRIYRSSCSSASAGTEQAPSRGGGGNQSSGGGGGGSSTTATTQAAVAPGRSLTAVLSGEESSALRAVLDTQRQRIIDKVGGAEELQLGALLEDLDVEESLAQAMLVSVYV